MNNAVVGKTMGNVIKLGDIKLLTTNARRNYLVSKPKYQTAKTYTDHLLAFEMNINIRNQ